MLFASATVSAAMGTRNPFSGRAVLGFRGPVLIQAVDDHQGDVFLQNEVGIARAVSGRQHVRKYAGYVAVADVERRGVGLARGRCCASPIPPAGPSWHSESTFNRQRLVVRQHAARPHRKRSACPAVSSWRYSLETNDRRELMTKLADVAGSVRVKLPRGKHLVWQHDRANRFLILSHVFGRQHGDRFHHLRADLDAGAQNRLPFFQLLAEETAPPSTGC